MTTKHSYRTGKVVALVAAIAALSAPIMSVTSSGAISAKPSAQPTTAAVTPAAASTRSAAASMLTLPNLNPTDLWACAGTTVMPNTASVQVWGYSTAACGPTSITKPGGPVITVTAGDTVSIILHNGLGLPAENTSLLFQGQAIPPDTTGATGGATPATGGTKTYTFVASKPGTFLYEAGLTPNGQHQVAMGLYGALVVRPALAPLQAYDTADTTVSTAFTDEGVLVLGEIDTALNNSGNKALFDMRNFKPKYFTINGLAYPATDPIPTLAGGTVLLRYVNAGISYHSMSVLGGSQQIIGYDGSPLKYPHSVAAETFGPGQTADALVNIPLTTANATKLAVYDGNLLLNNSTAVGFGGMMTFINVTATPGGDTTGPLVTAVAAAPNPSNGTGTFTLTATASDPSGVNAAEYRIGTSGAGTSFAFTAGLSVSLSQLAIPAPTVAGNYAIQVRARDTLLNWSGWSGTTLVVDTLAPAISNLTLTPNPSNGVGVALHATATDASTSVVAAEYWVDAGAHLPFTVTPAGTVSLDAVLATVVGAGSHTVSVRARDAALTWSPPSTINLVVDATGPVTSGVVANPSASNGAIGVNPTTPAVRVTANAADAAGSKVVAAEGFIDTVGLPGTGFVFFPADGAWSSPTEALVSDIPLTTINVLSAGSHTISVRSKDAVGTWGGLSSTPLVIDKTAPAIASINRVDPNPTSALTVNFLVTFSEAVTGVASSNFAIVETVPGTPTISAVTGSGATRTVTVTSGPGVGTIGLNLTSATGITDLAGNALPTTGLPFVGQVYTKFIAQPSLYFSTTGNINPTGVGGAADDADIYFYNTSTSTFSRSIDVSVAPYSLPAGANVDGFDRVDATHFYMSFDGNVTVPGIAGTVADEDIVFNNAGTWSLYFDGSVNGLTGGAATDLDAISIVGLGGPGNVYFSTDNNIVPPGAVGVGIGDDADIYRWNGGSSYTRVVDVSALGGSSNNVDGFVWVDATHFYLSFSPTTTTVTGPGTVQDEDVVFYNAGTWSVYFDGTAIGLGADPALDLDAFDVP